MKKLLVLLLATMLFPSSVNAAGKLPPNASDKKIDLYINSEKKEIASDMGKLYLDKTTQRTMVPIRYVSENLGCDIDYMQNVNIYGGKSIFIVAKSPKVIIMVDGDKKAYVAESFDHNKDIFDQLETVTLDANALIYDGRSYVPLRFVSELLGYDVDWDRDAYNNQYVNIRDKNTPKLNLSNDPNFDKPSFEPKVQNSLNLEYSKWHLILSSADTSLTLPKGYLIRFDGKYYIDSKRFVVGKVNISKNYRYLFKPVLDSSEVGELKNAKMISSLIFNRETIELSPKIKANKIYLCTALKNDKSSPNIDIYQDSTSSDMRLQLYKQIYYGEDYGLISMSAPVKAMVQECNKGYCAGNAYIKNFKTNPFKNGVLPPRNTYEQRVEAMVQYAIAMEGMPYHLYDCSRLVSNAANFAGFGSGFYTWTFDAEEYGYKEIPISQLRRGDILNKAGSHMMLYIGNKKVVEALPKKGVVISNLRTNGYKAYRPLEQ